MQTRSQRQGAQDPHAARGATDWHALEVQLNRTRTILQEILLHLQEVLRNLKMARRDFAYAPGAGSRVHTPGAGPSPHFRADRPQPPPSGTGATAGERSRSRHPGFERNAGQTRDAGTGDRHTATGGWSARTGTAGTRTTAGTTGTAGREHRSDTNRSTRSAGASGPTRERPRTENTWRTRTAGATGSERETKTTAGPAQRPGPRAAGHGQGFRLDNERQRRARETARKNGMNLKCAYDILCLDYPCSPDDIKNAYRHMARLYHPDLGGDEEAMKDVNIAYELAMRFCAGARRTSTAWAV